MQNQNKLLKTFFLHKITLKMLHFQTKYFGVHKAIDAYLLKFDLNFDRFMEVSQGIYGSTDLKKFELNIKVLNDSSVQKNLKQFVGVLNDISQHHDLLAIRDEMLADANQLKYLLEFK